MDAVIIYDSLTGNTLAAARTMGDELFDRGIGCRILPVVGLEEDEARAAVAAAELVIVGTWTDGALIIGQRPGRRKRFTTLLPDLTGKRCVVYCTYAIAPGKTLNKLQRVVEDHGGRVLGGLAIRQDRLDEGARDFIRRTLDAVPAA